MARKKMDLNLDLTLILTMDLNFAVGKKGIALLEVAVSCVSVPNGLQKVQGHCLALRMLQLLCWRGG